LLLLLAVASNEAYLAEAVTTNDKFTPYFLSFSKVCLHIGTGHEPFKPPIRNATTAASAALPAGGGALCPFLQGSAHPY
jgi:hypothetical protein